MNNYPDIKCDGCPLCEDGCFCADHEQHAANLSLYVDLLSRRLSSHDRDCKCGDCQTMWRAINARNARVSQ